MSEPVGALYERQGGHWGKGVALALVLLPVVYLGAFFPLASMWARPSAGIWGFGMVPYSPLPRGMKREMYRAWRKTFSPRPDYATDLAGFLDLYVE